MLTQETKHVSPAQVTPVAGQRGSGHLVVSLSTPRSDTVPEVSRRWRRNEAVGKPGTIGANCESALKPRAAWEGLRKKCQGPKPDLRNSAVRDYRGASRNVVT